ncbi:MAG: hypothetical protein K6U80_09490 [Firmicutes bacterium]|nr:hypothetical protein [Bacillota bacterium]
MKFKLVFFLFIGTFLLLGMIASPVSGAESHFLLSPPVVELVVGPGEEVPFEVTLSNENLTNSVNFKVRLSSIRQNQDGSYEPVDGEVKYSALPWLVLKGSYGLVKMGPKDSITVKCAARLPRNAVGSAAAGLIFEVAEDKAPDGQKRIATDVTQQAMSVIKVTAKNRLNRPNASITGIKVIDAAVDRRFLEYGKNTVAIACSVHNEGNVILRCQGRLIIRDHSGKRVKDVPLGAGRGTVLPETVVDMVSVFPKGLPEGDYTAEIWVYYGVSRPLQAKLPFSIASNKASSGEASALKTVRLQVNPDVFDVKIPAGGLRSFVLNLANEEDNPVSVKGAVVPVEGLGQAKPADSWLNFGPAEFILRPGERKAIRFSIAVPKNAEDGTRYSNIVIEAKPEGALAKGMITSLSTPVVVSTGQILKKAVLSNAAVNQPNPGVWLFGGMLKNIGNTHLTGIEGKAIVKKRALAKNNSSATKFTGQGAFTDFITLPLEEIANWVLPGSTIPVAALYEKRLEPGEYNVEIQVDIGEKLPVVTNFTFMVTPAK